MVNRVLQFVSRESSPSETRRALPANSTFSRSVVLLGVSLVTSLLGCGLAFGQASAAAARPLGSSGEERETRLYATRAVADTLSASEAMAIKRNSLRKEEVVVPVNTLLALEIRSAVNSRTAYVGQPVYCVTIYPVVVDDRIVIPVASFVRGQVTSLTRPGRNRPAEIGLQFDKVTLPGGLHKPLRASVTSFSTTGAEEFSPDKETIAGPRPKRHALASAAKGAAQWSVVGSMAAAGSNKGAVWGGTLGLAGAAVSFVSVLTARGDEVVLTPGANLELRLDEPLVYANAEINMFGNHSTVAIQAGIEQ